MASIKAVSYTHLDRIHDRINDGKENRLESGEAGAGGGVERVGQRAQNTGQQQEEKSAGI